jgi:hypothetical protein
MHFVSSQYCLDEKDEKHEITNEFYRGHSKKTDVYSMYA